MSHACGVVCDPEVARTRVARAWYDDTMGGAMGNTMGRTMGGTYKNDRQSLNMVVLEVETITTSSTQNAICARFSPTWNSTVWQPDATQQSAESKPISTKFRAA